MMRTFFDWILGRTKLRQVNDTLSAMVSDLQRQVDSLQKQVTHAAKATNDMGAHSRQAEVTLAKVRLAFAEERRINKDRFGHIGVGYTVIAEDFALTQGSDSKTLHFHQPSQPKQIV